MFHHYCLHYIPEHTEASPTAGPPHDPFAHTRTQPDVAIVVVVVAGVVAVAVAAAVCTVLYKKNKGQY